MSKVDIVEVGRQELEAALERVTAGRASVDDLKLIEKIAKAYLFLLGLLERKKTTISRLRRIIFGSKSEKTKSVFKGEQGANQEQREQERKPRKGHGRNGAEAYRSAEKIRVVHASLQAGDCCPACERGKVYHLSKCEELIRIIGQAPLQGRLYELERLRCNGCGHVFKAKPPAGVGTAKYDETVPSMIGLLKYGTGMPFTRLEKLEHYLGLPLPAATQWELVDQAAQQLEPAYEELVRQAAQGKVLHNDDTGAKILELMAGKPQRDSRHDSKRTGMFTSGIVSIGEHKIALFFTGQRHAGENLEAVLRQRSEKLPPPIQMCDALSRNLPSGLDVIGANCLSHCRRLFVDVAGSFPDECKHLLDTFTEVYKHDATTKAQHLPDEERLAFHQQWSQPLMDGLQRWATELIEQRKVEPNSGLGEALAYLLKHWEKLTLFLRQAGAPLDNNVCERALKKAILHRKNAYFYKTEHGAHVGDIFMTLIHTTELCEANPFNYLVALQRHARLVADNPAQWMPWNYCAALEQLVEQRSTTSG